MLDGQTLASLRTCVFFIGGGTCSGKTTRAAELCGTGRLMFSADDVLMDCAARAHADGSEIADRALSSDFERRWMRDPAVQFAEMLDFYHAVFPYIAMELAEFAMRVESDASNCGCGRSTVDAPFVVAEGIAFLPDLLAEIGIPKDHCLFLVSEKSIHDQRYIQREWVPLMLEGCSDPQAAFDRWMQRDELFSRYIREQCAQVGYSCNMHAFA